MILSVAGAIAARFPALTAILTLAATASAHLHQHGPFLHLLIRFGVVGIFLVSIVDSSFVPLPIPGLTDIMLVLFAAQHTNFLLLILIATLGSAIGGYLSYQVGHAGGMQFLEKHVPKRIFKRVTRWMENHALLAVSLPAILPPPMPLSPFVLAAGVLNMSRRRFLTAFTLSRAARHSIAVGLGIYYGRQVLGLWSRFSDKWATTFLVVLWSFILVGCGFAFWKIYQTSRSFKPRSTAGDAISTSQAPAS